MKRRELKNRIQKSGHGLQDDAGDIWRPTQETYPSMDTEFVESAAVDSFVDEIQDWEACIPARTSLQHWLMHWKLKYEE